MILKIRKLNILLFIFFLFFAVNLFANSIYRGFEPWDEIKKLTAFDAEIEDYFGSSVAVAGDVALVGATHEDSAGTNSGAAYIFERNKGGENNWGELKKLTATDTQKITYFGNSVALDRNVAVISSWASYYGGSAYVFERDAGGTNNWGQINKIVSSDLQVGDSFGTSIAISKNLVIVGAKGEDAGGSAAGAAYIFKQNLGGTNNWGEVKKLIASDASSDDWFGCSVAISSNIAIVGAYKKNNGAGVAYIFEENFGGTNNWGEIKKLTAFDPDANDYFGFSVAIEKDTAIVGACGDNLEGSTAGAAYIFERDFGGTNNWGQFQKITAADAHEADWFAYSVAIESNKVLIGTDSRFNLSAAYIFEKNNANTSDWNEIEKLTGSDTQERDRFGFSVGLAGEIIIIGVPREDFYGTNAGAVYIFEKSTIPEPCLFIILLLILFPSFIRRGDR